MSTGLLLEASKSEYWPVCVEQVERLIDEARGEFLATGGDESGWAGMLVTVPDCEGALLLHSIVDLPLESVPCPCGDPDHWVILYKIREGQ